MQLQFDSFEKECYERHSQFVLTFLESAQASYFFSITTYFRLRTKLLTVADK